MNKVKGKLNVLLHPCKIFITVFFLKEMCKCICYAYAFTTGICKDVQIVRINVEFS